METKPVRGRFAPSPSGRMHLGNIFCALMAWLPVRAAGGEMVLRIEDLDPDRSRMAYAAQMEDDLTWFGMDWDEGGSKGGPQGPYYQSQRTQQAWSIPATAPVASFTQPRLLTGRMARPFIRAGAVL